MPRILLLSNPRSGSHFLRDLLNSHPEIHLKGELINDEVDVGPNPTKHIEEKLSTRSETFAGFKAFPEQIFQRNLHLSSLAKEVGISHIIILWREGILETLVSRRIADKNGMWYAPNKGPEEKENKETKKQIEIDPEDLKKYTEDTLTDWNKIADQWPLGVTPIYVKFENLLQNPMGEVQIILSKLACPCDNFTPTVPSKRQNPSSLEDKVSNFHSLPLQLRDGLLNVKEILDSKLLGNPVIEGIPQEILPFVPNREPTIPPGGYRYRVAEPFISEKMKQNVIDAMEAGSISSAGHWPRLLASKLKQLFQLPVAQPCCNGFTALMLAMQCAEIGEGDEVIMPSMTMVAVPNAAHFLKAKPVFADNSSGDYNYNPGLKEILSVASEKTKAVVLTHTYGVPSPDLEALVEECEKRGWWLIEDISEAVGVKVGDGKLLGTFGHFACASMYVNKMVHAGDGGFVLAKDPKFAGRLTSLVNHGFTPSYHFVHFEPALNAKINGVGAAIASGCLDEIGHIMSHRNEVAQMYREGLKGLPMKLMPVCGPLDTPWVFGLTCKDKEERTQLREFLAKKGIETRDFFFALHLQPAYYSEKETRRLPNCEELGSTGFYLPTHSNLRKEDVTYISTCIQKFFHLSNPDVFPFVDLGTQPKKMEKFAVQIPPGKFSVEVRTYNDSGSLKTAEGRSHLYFEAVELGFNAENLLIREKWDSKAIWLEEVKACLAKAEEMGEEVASNIQNYFNPYITYFESQLQFEQVEVSKAWIHEDVFLQGKEYQDPELSSALKKIPTTSDEETLQLLLHLIREQRPSAIWEIGCWFGHSTFLMAALSENINLQNKIFACDAFKWQKWMSQYIRNEGEENILPGQSFLNRFKKFTEKFESRIQPVVWPYDISELPETLKNQRPDLIYLDITQEEEDLDLIWTLIKEQLIPDKTLILFNGLSEKSIPFFTKHCKELKPFAKPSTMAKAFIYSSNKESLPEKESAAVVQKKLNFQSDPDWTHHHKNLFCSSISLLREKFHDPSSPVLFFPAIEEKMCDEPDLFLKNPWMGIIHSIPFYPQQFYTPDLARLCNSKMYRRMMSNCRGLFTLTQVQSDFLKKNLPKELAAFPIQTLKYPVEEDLSFQGSSVPQMWREGKKIGLVFIGSFARDFDLFYNTEIPNNLKKILVTGDEESVMAGKRAPSEVTVLTRLGNEEYEEMLKKSVIFLSLIADGAANTIILECISRHVPIVCPRMLSCIEYLGEEYPLFYNQENPGLETVITLENIEAAIKYLREMGKGHLSRENMMKSFENGAVLQSIPATIPGEISICKNNIRPQFSQYDVTICICSYKRTHHLPSILHSIWNNQDFSGSFQIIIWNNNDARQKVVRRICNKYLTQSNEEKSLEIISSTENHYCSIRFAMPALMRSKALLICDDDIIPGNNFVSFFLSNHLKHPKDVLCVRGHSFLEHQLDLDNPKSTWEDYEYLRFKDDNAPEQFIHFVHADACLIPKGALREIASVEMPDNSFTLVDDYWMSYVLSHKFGRKLRKLSVAGLESNPVNRTDDSDQVGLALHTRPEVQDARIRLYIYHMLQNWPKFSKGNEAEKEKTVEETELLKATKAKFFDGAKVGFNISSGIDISGIKALQNLGVTAVRIGAVGIAKELDYDLSGFLTDPEKQMKELEETVNVLGEHGIRVVITVDRRLASANTWAQIAKTFRYNPNVFGYDLINEPFTEEEKELHWIHLEEREDAGINRLITTYKTLITAVRKFDDITPIIIEPSFWGRCYALKKFPIKEFTKIDSNLIFSFHFYEPMLLTQRHKNKGRFSFPGETPVYDNIAFSEKLMVDEEFIKNAIEDAVTWGTENGVKVFLGEFGICRDVKGAERYLEAGLNACKSQRIPIFLFSFRDEEWEAMNYEFGPDYFNCIPAKNGLIDTIKKFI